MMTRRKKNETAATVNGEMTTAIIKNVALCSSRRTEQKPNTVTLLPPSLILAGARTGVAVVMMYKVTITFCLRCLGGICGKQEVNINTSRDYPFYDNNPNNLFLYMKIIYIFVASEVDLKVTTTWLHLIQLNFTPSQTIRTVLKLPILKMWSTMS